MPEGKILLFLFHTLNCRVAALTTTIFIISVRIYFTLKKSKQKFSFKQDRVFAFKYKLKCIKHAGSSERHDKEKDI